ncbi:uncharacterized protein CLV35_1019 [Motilibacter peucedani]|uniref:DUF177 domain-containing protein n=1 Tax=Motilibacter peucedani TaxID=598650 RepID=A0A420XR51_9ACTN|nr:uncharacterized protein CLV35_1019 [Motilibacter peucedani]
MPRRDRDQETAPRLDPRQPLVIDTRELGRRPGSMKRVNRTVPAPAGLGSDVIGVAQGSDLALELRLEAVMEGVLVSGTALATVTGECVRCLDPIEHELEVDVQELFAYPESSSAEAEEDEVHHLEGDLLDVEPVVRDAVVLALPLQPVCEDDCPGLCVECGARLADDPDHGHEVADPRWAALSGLLPGDEAEPAAPHQP